MSALAVAAGTALAAESAAAVAGPRGNAVDAAIAATFATWVCEPGLTSLGSGGFCTIWKPGEEPVTVDGFVEMPGRTAEAGAFGRATPVVMDYGGGTRTMVGPGSIGTPGALAALELAWRRWGSVPWPQLIAPAIDLARRGFPLPQVSHTYFRSSAELIFTITADARVLHERPGGGRREMGEIIVMTDLADALEAIAAEGARVLYQGDLGRRIGDWVRDHGGLLGADDMAAYRPEVRPCLEAVAGRWRLATNPLPAVGGVVLREIAALMDRQPQSIWSSDSIALFARAMQIAFTDRRMLLAERDLSAAAAKLDGDGLARRRAELAGRSSPSTSHTSAVDRSGLACSITTSTGYSSGVIVPGTGIMLNNCLGELELFPGGLHEGIDPGERLRSNMAPSIARSDDGSVIALGAAGAERIASALAQVWLNVANLGMHLSAAVAQPRCHFEWRDGRPTLAHEPGVDASAVACAAYPFPDRHMFFGGVQAAERTAEGRLHAVGDPRRAGGMAVA